MMKSNLTGKVSVILATASLCVLFSCKKTFDLQPKSVVDISNNYRNVTDANAAVLGVYGKFLNLAEQYVVLNELRADLMDVTPNADKYLKEISQHHVTIGNPWADPRPFYAVINDCNDILANLNIMLAANRIAPADYSYRYSDVGALRSFLYLQLGIHFGSVPYVTDPIANINDLKDASKYPKLAFKDLLTQLITFTSKLPWLQPYPNVITLINGSTATTPATPATLSGFNFTNYFINKYMLLGDLYLWHAAYDPNDYRNAATYYKLELELPATNPATITGSNAVYQFLKVPYADVVTHKDFAIGYTRYRDQDINQLINSNTLGWRSIFGRTMYPTYDTFLDTEWIWQINFPQSTSPVDPFVDLFSPQGGRYLVQPSQTAINNWNSQVQAIQTSSGFSTTFYQDARGRLTYTDPTNSYSTFNNQNVIEKYLYTYQDASVSQSNKYGRWFLYRAAELHLRYAEAANRDGRTRLAYAMLNVGVSTVFNPYNYTLTPPPVTTPSGAVITYPATSSLGSVPNGDVTNVMQTFDIVPYDLDARNGATPYYRGEYYQQQGPRSRANLVSYPLSYADPANPANPQLLEDALILEDGLELAYEGHRWPDLLRIALRRNDPTFLSNKVYDKLSKDGYAGAGSAQAKLAGGDFYLPFNW